MTRQEIFHHTLDFARYAAATAWSERCLSRFFTDSGVPSADQAHYWPKGIRSMGHWLNAYADEKMVEDAALCPRSLSEIIWRRFENNTIFKPSVGKLACSDLMHPIDTIKRTWKTARAMLRCSGAEGPAVRVLGLTILYSACVLIWLWERDSDHPQTHRVVDVSARLIGGQ